MDKNTLLSRIRALTEPMSPLPVGHEARLDRLKSIKCVAFDFYGTMFISGVGDIGIDEEQDTQNAASFDAALNEAGFEVPDEGSDILGINVFQETINRHINQKQQEGIEYPEPDIITVWLEVLQALAQQSLIEGEATKEKAIRFAIEFEFRVNPIWPVPDLAQVLSKLLIRNIALGIISNSQFYTPLAFEAIIGKSPETFGFDPDLLNWSYASGLKKPSLKFYKLFTDVVEQEKKFTPSEVLYVGNDIRKDIRPAKNLGMKTALFVGDSRSIRHRPEELQQPEFSPDIVIDDLMQIIECLN